MPKNAFRLFSPRGENNRPVPNHNFRKIGANHVTQCRSQFSEAIYEALNRQFPDADGYTYLPPSDEPLDWHLGGVIRLDHAILAIRLACARYVLRSFLHAHRLRVEAAIRTAETVVLKQAGKLLIGEFFNQIVRPLFLIADIWNATRIQKEEEAAIRRAFLLTQRDVCTGRQLAPKVGQRRVTKRVASRHESK